MVVRREAKVHGGLAVPEFGDERDGAVVIDSEVHPSLRRLHEPATVHTGQLKRENRHGPMRPKGGGNLTLPGAAGFLRRFAFARRRHGPPDWPARYRPLP